MVTANKKGTDAQVRLPTTGCGGKLAVLASSSYSRCAGAGWKVDATNAVAQGPAWGIFAQAAGGPKQLQAFNLPMDKGPRMIRALFPMWASTKQQYQYIINILWG